MKKKTLLILFILILVSCRNEDGVESRKEIQRVKESKNVEKNISKDPILYYIKKGILANSFEIGITQAREISKDRLIGDKILSKAEIRENKSYIILEYEIKDLRDDLDFIKNQSHKDIIKTKCLCGNMVKKEEIGKKYKNKSTLREIIEVDRIENKIELNFEVEDKELDMIVIL